MIFGICTGIFLCIAFALTCLTKKRIEETLAPAAFLIILILYIFGGGTQSLIR